MRIGHLDGALQGTGCAVGQDDRGSQFHMMDIGGAHGDAPIVNIGLISGHEPHVTIDTRTSIPAAVLLLGVVHTHHNLIASCRDIGGGIYPEARVAVGPSASLMTIDIDV